MLKNVMLLVILGKSWCILWWMANSKEQHLFDRNVL